MTTPPYEIVSLEDVSTGIASRRRCYVLIAPDDAGQAGAVAFDAMQETIRDGADVGFVFVYDDWQQVGKTAAIARATYVRRGIPKQAVPLPLPAESTQVRETVTGRITVMVDRVGVA